MKKVTLSVKEKHERITIRYRRKTEKRKYVCQHCGKQINEKKIEEKKS